MLDAPVLLAPTAAPGLFHADGEIATVRGPADSDALLTLSTFSSWTTEEVGSAARGPSWFRLHVHGDRGLTADLVRRARSARTGACVWSRSAPLSPHGASGTRGTAGRCPLTGDPPTSRMLPRTRPPAAASTVRAAIPQ
ncbi:alpha-hydroxy-acid oxidizing protein [Streptomyces adustus]|uniref:alpha-hydroxy-acid oxidizing protein n=1 Tax=Streptomyces adustus TaxID=1609272 RepID=UPI001390EAB4